MAPIIDSHIHLNPSSALPTLPWRDPSHPLHREHSVSDYNSATGSPSSLSGFILIEADHSSNDDPNSWTPHLQEVSFMSTIANNNPSCLALIPWAPLPEGAAKLEEYLTAAEKEVGTQAWKKVRGFRFLLQDQPAGTGTSEGFVEALKVLGKKGYVFEVGINQHRKGKRQLEEVWEMISRVQEGVEEGERVKFVLNHLCKPDLTILNQADPSFLAWREAMFTLSKCPQTYIKLSGCFSELPEKLRQRPAEDIVSAILPWLAVLLAAWGPKRIMFGSDWPVCTVGVGNDEAWKKWHRVVELVCDFAGLSVEDQERIWSGTAKEAYGLE